MMCLGRYKICRDTYSCSKVFMNLAHFFSLSSRKAAPPAPGLADRRVEITGPVDRKMVINALNSGASTFMADFEGLRL